MDYYEIITLCNDCRACEEVCPVYEITKQYSPNHKINIALKLLNEERLLVEEINDIYACMRCGACEEICTQKIPVTEIVRLSRKKIADLGLIPDTHKKIIENIENKGISLNKEPKERDGWIKQKNINLNAKYVYLTGCFASVVNSNIARSTGKILENAGVKYTVLGSKEVCCGVFALDNGMDDVVIENIEKNINVINYSGSKDVIVACPACYKIYNRLYNQIVDRYNINVKSIIEIIHLLAAEKKIKFKKKVNSTVFIHRSCNIDDDQYNSVVDTIKKTPDIQLVNIKNKCCGAASGVKPMFPDISLNIGSKILEDAINSGADILITTCPFCNFQFNDVKKRKNYEIKVMDFTEFISELI